MTTLGKPALDYNDLDYNEADHLHLTSKI